MASIIERLTRKIYSIEFRDDKFQDLKVKDLNADTIPIALSNRGQIKRGYIG